MKKKLMMCISVVIAVAAFSLLPESGAEAAVRRMPDGRDFDASFYAATYPDVYAAFGMNETLLYQHYLMFGIAEKRLPYAGAFVPASSNETTAPASTVITMPDGGKFDPVFYARKYPDVVAVLGNDATALYNHYLYYGMNEGRLPYEGAPKSELKITFTPAGVVAQVSTPEDVMNAVRQAAKFRVTTLTIITTWNGTLSAEGVTAYVNAQSAYLKTAYNATAVVTDSRVYGNIDNLTIETEVALRFR
ncbi:MAG: hypothetical protein K5871_06090 [Lachnospiraceae bacterium]|nr:hypothetical protein [Lachnospiraceae bacterium]